MAKRGGNMKLTKLRRIEGDVTALRNDLREALGLEEKEVTINQLTRHIIVKVCYG
jgi:large subunit ribosomal protein L49